VSHDAAELARLGWRDHRQALWWLGVLYRRPRMLDQALGRISGRQSLRTVAILYFHALPYLILISIIGRVLLFGWMGMEAEEPIADLLSDPVGFHLFWFSVGVVLGAFIIIAFWVLGLVFKRVARWTTPTNPTSSMQGLTIGITSGIGLGIMAGGNRSVPPFIEGGLGGI